MFVDMGQAKREDVGSVDAIEFPAIVQKVQTLADGGIRATFDMPETCVMQAAELMACKRVEVALMVSVTADKQENTGEQSRNLETGTKRKSEWQTA